MSRLSAGAGALGALAGLWSLTVSFLGGMARSCPSGGCPATGAPPLEVATIALSIGLICSSVASFLWHRGVLYVSVFLSALLAAAVLFDAAETGPLVLWVADVLSVASAVANLIAARRRIAMPEQSHPLNLPVFG